MQFTPSPALTEGQSAPARRWFGMSPRALVFFVLLAGYAALTVLILVKSPVLTFDEWLLRRHLWNHHPGWHPWIRGYVILGQRGPATLFFLPFFFWVAWREKSTRPLVMLVTALILLNLSIGVAKIITGRVGPLLQNNDHAVFAGGNIYPSGHVSNVIVLYALITWIAPKYRKTLIAATVWLSVSVGLSTVYLRTHWFSDVVGGWLAGALVLLALPTVMPAAQRATDRAIAWAGPRVMGRERPRHVAQWLYATAQRFSPGPATLREYARPEMPLRPMVAAAAQAPASAPAPAQPMLTPVSSAAKSHSFPAMMMSLDGLDESTRRSDPRSSATPSGS